MLQGNQQLNQTTPQYVSQPAQSAFTELVQNDMNTLPQASPSQNTANFANFQGVRGAEVAIEVEAEVEVEEVQYYVIGVETSYLKNKLVIKWLNVPIRNKPKIAGGKISLVMFKGDSSFTIGGKGKLTRGTTYKSKGEVPVVSPNDSKPLKEIKRMLELEKNSSKSTSVDDTSHSFTPTSNVRNGFRRKKGDSPFTYN